MNSVSPFDIAAFAYIILTVLGLIIIYSILKRIVRKLGEVWSQESLFGSDQKTRLLSLGVVAILFPSIFFSLGSAIINFISNFFVDVPKALLSNWLAGQAACAGAYEQTSLCIGKLGSEFIQAWTSALSDSLEGFGPSSISYSRLIIMLAVWTGVALFLSAPSSKDHTEGSGQKTRLQHTLNRLSPAAKQNIVFFGILLVAGYLSIAAIAAIPGLEESAVPSETVSLERLQQQLDEAFAEYQARIPQDLQLSDPFSTPVAATGTPMDATPVPVETIADINLSNLKFRREQLLSLYPKLLEDLRRRANNAKSSGISTYQASILERKGTKQTVQHFLDIEAWYQRVLNRMETQLNVCRRSIGATDSLFQTLASEKDTTYLNNMIDQVLTSAEQNVRDACQSTTLVEAVPPREDLGSNMGPFSYVASWLLRTESLPLAQIVGLLGFGLLGSAVSSLVRKNPRARSHEFVTEELAAMVIRGATAAVVVFLAVKGGLAVFTSGEGNPNSYVLLLTCLIAAVFSEDVWREAHEWLKRDLSIVDETTTHVEEKSLTVDKKTSKASPGDSTDVSP